MGAWFFDAALGWLVSILAGTLQLVWRLLAGFALTSPDVTVLPQVATVTGRSLLVVNTCYVVAVMVAGVLVMTRETVQTRYGIGELAPRLVVGLVAANLATPLCRGLVEAANALTAALTGESITSSSGLRHLEATVAGAMGEQGTPGPQQLLLVVFAVLVLALTVMLLLGWLVRLGLLVVLTGIAPLALACHGLPQTEPVARLWWRSMLAVLFIVTAQAFALHTTLTVFLSPQANLPALGVPADPGGSINLLIVTCLLWATVRIPALARRYVTRTGPPPGAALVRVLLVQQFTRGLRPGRSPVHRARP